MFTVHLFVLCKECMYMFIYMYVLAYSMVLLFEELRMNLKSTEPKSTHLLIGELLLIYREKELPKYRN